MSGKFEYDSFKQKIYMTSTVWLSFYWITVYISHP